MDELRIMPLAGFMRLFRRTVAEDSWADVVAYCHDESEEEDNGLVGRTDHGG